MKNRLITGLIMFAILMGFIYLSSINQIFFDALIFIAAYIALFEMFRSTKKAGYNTMSKPIIIMAVISYPLCYVFGLSGLLLAVVVAFIATFVSFIFNGKFSFNDLLVTTFIIIYPFLFVGLGYTLNKEYGMLPFLIALGGTLMTDTLAFMTGVTFKGPKIFPNISPKKTYSGCIGGLFGGVLGSILAYFLFEAAGFPCNNTPFTFGGFFSSPILAVALIGFGVGLFAEVGDLAASRIKRELGIKDYGKILGSHGGVMDRLDSILFSVLFMTVFMFFIHTC